MAAEIVEQSTGMAAVIQFPRSRSAWALAAKANRAFDTGQHDEARRLARELSEALGGMSAEELREFQQARQR